MREYRMPIDISEKEKIIGGVLTVQQGICLAIGFAVAIVVSLLCKKIGWPSIIIGLVLGAGVGCVLAFVKVHTYTIWTFLRLLATRKTSVLENVDFEKEAARARVFGKSGQGGK